MVKKVYLEDTQLVYLPKQYQYEDCRVKHYKVNEGRFDAHIDAYNADSGLRYLAFLFYLNDVSLGGETEFLIQNGLKIVPKKGRVIVFPPNFMFPHKGNVPLSNDKFIISTYMRYVNG